MAGVTMDKVTKVYPNGVAAVIDLDLDIAEGEFLVLVGPSGCGKSTALRMVAGLETITSGELRIGDRVVNDLPPKERDIAMVFQNYALYPHMTVEQNIGFALKLAKLPKDEIRERVLNAAKVLQLEEWLNRKPGQLSGGQRQRVAMGRAIVRDPSVFLMDEPLSNLDAKLRAQTRAEIASLQRSLGTTTIYVTHDQIEAMTMGDRVAVMRDGRLQQVDEPEVLYAETVQPVRRRLHRVAVDEPARGHGRDQRRRSHGVPRRAVAARPRRRPRRPAGATGLRRSRGRRRHPPRAPHRRGVGQRGAPTAGARLRGVVELREALGSELLVHVRTDCRPAVTDEVRSVAGDLDEAAVDILERQAAGEGAMVVARFDARSRARVTDAVEMDVDVDRLQFFDPETGLRIADEELVPAGAEAAPTVTAPTTAAAPSDG